MSVAGSDRFSIRFFAKAAVLASALGLGFAVSAFALPVDWTNVWIINQLSSDPIGAAAAQSAFGASAIQDGEINDVNADLAVAKAAASAQSIIDQRSSGDAIVEFGRPFRLSGPGLWKVTLFGTLTGDLHVRTADADVDALAFIDAVARILDKNGDPVKDGDVVFEIGSPDDFTWHDHLIRSLINEGPNDKFVLASLDQSMVLGPGDYSVYGKLEALAGAGMGVPGIANASSLFFNSLIVGISVTAAPEPSTLMLLCAGIFGLIALRACAVLIPRVAQAAAGRRDLPGSAGRWVRCRNARAQRAAGVRVAPNARLSARTAYRAAACQKRFSLSADMICRQVRPTIAAGAR